MSAAGPARRARSPLSVQRIAQAALELADREGLDALSMRRLADELETAPMTLYGYVRAKDELLDAIVDVAMRDVELPPASGSWRERLAALAWATRRNLDRHPALVQIRLRRPILTPTAFRSTEAGMQALADAGLPPAEAAHAFRILFVYTFGAAVFSVASPDVRRALDDAAAALAALPREGYPALRAAAGDLPWTLSGDEQFAYGLERILDGLQARLDALAPEG